MRRLKRWFLCGTLLIILPATSSSHALLLTKTSITLPEKGSIEYSLAFSKQDLEIYRGYPVLSDRFSPYTRLSYVKQTPSAYYFQHERKEGYPLLHEYEKVIELEWTMESSRRFRYSQHHFSAEKYGSHGFRKDLLHLPESTIAWTKNYTYGHLMPVVDLVEGKQYVFVTSTEGLIEALHPSTGKTHWSFRLPLGERVDQPMSTFIRHCDTLLSAGTSDGNLYFLSGKSGAMVHKIMLDGSLTAPLYSFEHGDQQSLVAITSKNMFCVDLSSLQIRWKINNPGHRVHSPFSLQVGTETHIITSSVAGVISALHLDGTSAWERSVQGGLPHGITGFVRETTPYIAGVSSDGSAFLMEAVHGLILERINLPGTPRSPISIHPSHLTFGVITEDAQNTENSFFFTESFLAERRLQGRVFLPGKQFLDLQGVQVGELPFYYLVDHKAQLWMMQHGLSRPLQGYPFPLTFHIGADYPHQLGGMALTEYALYVACPGQGLFAYGVPEQMTEDRSFRRAPSSVRSHTHYRNDTDLLPRASIHQKLPAQFPGFIPDAPFPEPAVFFHPQTRKLYLVRSTPEGDLQLYNQQGDIEIYLTFQSGPFMVAPIFEERSPQEIRIYVLSSTQLQAWSWNLKTQRIKKRWERKDLKNTQTTFMKVDQRESSRLFLIDHHKYLTSVCADSGETFFRQAVDAWQFAYYVIYARPYLFCGSKKIDAMNGKVLAAPWIRGSHSSLLGVAGRVYLFQSDDMHMIAWDAHTLEPIWRVRRLWCRAYCSPRTSPAALFKGHTARVYWSDYRRLLCIDVLRGLIVWRQELREDYFLSSPAVAENEKLPVVFAGSIEGRVYAFDAMNGKHLEGFPLRISASVSSQNEPKGCSTPLIVNGSMMIYHWPTGLVQVDEVKENNRDFKKYFFEVVPRNPFSRESILNQATVQWDGNTVFSNIVRD